MFGSILDAKRAAEIAHSKGALLLLDGCQAVPRLDVNIVTLGADFYAFSGHKLYGPTGIGCLWGRAELLAQMPPWQGGGAMIDKVTFEETTFLDPPARFEAGTPHIVGAIGLHAAVNWVEKIGLDAIHAHECALVAECRAALAASPASRSTALKTAPGSSASTSTGCIRTTPPPYWTMRASPSAPATIALSR